MISPRICCSGVCRRLARRFDFVVMMRQIEQRACRTEMAVFLCWRSRAASKNVPAQKKFCSVRITRSGSNPNVSSEP